MQTLLIYKKKRDGSSSGAGLNSSFSSLQREITRLFSLCPHENCVRALWLDSSASDVSQLKKKEKNKTNVGFFPNNQNQFTLFVFLLSRFFIGYRPNLSPPPFFELTCDPRLEPTVLLLTQLN